MRTDPRVPRRSTTLGTPSGFFSSVSVMEDSESASSLGRALRRLEGRGATDVEIVVVAVVAVAVVAAAAAAAADDEIAIPVGTVIFTVGTEVGAVVTGADVSVISMAFLFVFCRETSVAVTGFIGCGSGVGRVRFDTAAAAAAAGAAADASFATSILTRAVG